MSNSSQPIQEIPKGVRISVHAQPGARKTELMGLHGDAIKIRVHAPPLDGRANEELIHFLADQVGVPRSHVTLVRGEKSRTKIFEIQGVSGENVTSRLLG